MSIHIFRLLLPVVFLFIEMSAIAIADPKIMLWTYNRRLANNVYYVEIWASLAPNEVWRISDCDIYLQCNRNALDESSYRGGAVFDLDNSLTNNSSYSCKQDQVGSPYFFASLSIVQENFSNVVVKTAGSSGMDFRIGTLRFDLIPGRGGEMDGINFTPQFVALSEYDPGSQTTRLITLCNQNPPGNCTLQQFSLLGSSPRIIDQSGVACVSKYYRTLSCSAQEADYITTTPLTANCSHWPDQAGPGGSIHVAYYNTDIDLTQGMPAAVRLRGLNTSELNTLAENARCRWERQLDFNEFEWRTTTTGGWFYWETDIAKFLGTPGALALTTLAYDSNTPHYIKDSSTCGYVAGLANHRSEVKFNNSAEFWVRNPHVRWTTDMAACGGGPDCRDFYTIVLHETGHYLGLTHQDSWEAVMCFASASYGPHPFLHQCDADNIRRLYAPTRTGIPDNLTFCGPTDVQEYSGETALDQVFSVRPNPVVGNEVGMRYRLAKPGDVRIYVYDLLGNRVQTILEGYQEQGVKDIQVGLDVPDGVYFIALHLDRRNYLCKIVVKGK